MSACATLIAGDEESVICRCLRRLRPLVTQIAVVSSGTDETADIIREHSTDWGIEHRVEHRDWTGDFAAARNASVELALTMGPDILVTVDPDDMLVGTPKIEGNSRIWVHDGTLQYPRIFAWRASLGARYEMPVHETLLVPGHSPIDFPILEGCHIERNGSGRADRDPHTFEKDAEILGLYVKERPNDPRAVFYLAQSLRDAGKFSAAQDQYERCVAITTRDEERYVAKLEAARCLERSMGTSLYAAAPWILSKYEDAYKLRPQRAEAVYSLLRFARRVDSLEHLRKWTPVWLGMPVPKGDVLFVDHACYPGGAF